MKPFAENNLTILYTEYDNGIKIVIVHSVGCIDKVVIPSHINGVNNSR